MIVCKVCGNRNNDQEEFCTSCGRYLAWSGEHVDVAPEAEPELVPEDAYEEARPPGFFRRLAISLHLVTPASHAVPGGGQPSVGAPPQATPAAEGTYGDGGEGVYVIGTLPRPAAASLAAAPASPPAAELASGGGTSARRSSSFPRSSEPTTCPVRAQQVARTARAARLAARRPVPPRAASQVRGRRSATDGRRRSAPGRATDRRARRRDRSR